MVPPDLGLRGSRFLFLLSFYIEEMDMDTMYNYEEFFKLAIVRLGSDPLIY